VCARDKASAPGNEQRRRRADIDDMIFTPLAPRAAVIAFRDRLLANNSPDDFRIAVLMGAPSDADATQFGLSLRADGVLLGVWSAPTRPFVYPAYQFDTRGGIGPEVVELLEVLSTGMAGVVGNVHSHDCAVAQPETLLCGFLLFSESEGVRPRSAPVFLHGEH
jgi:hypothetical protein